MVKVLKRCYNGYKVYLHNFSSFDGIFLTGIIANLEECNVQKCILNDGKILDIQLSNKPINNSRKYSISFRDSLLMLPSKLKDLSKYFETEQQKTLFPHKFLNNDIIKLDYVGEVPEIKYFDNIKVKDYNQYKNNYNKWYLENEILLYCENDVKCLWHVIKKFQKNIYKRYMIDINNYLTLPSLTLGIYRTQYLKENTIPKIIGLMYWDIKQSYTGGSVDVYKTFGKNILRYDVNSLYPSVMQEYPSPTGNIYSFNGNILLKDCNAFGFFYVKVRSPNINIPILQNKVKTPNGNLRTIAPIGNW